MIVLLQKYLLATLLGGKQLQLIFKIKQDRK